MLNAAKLFPTLLTKIRTTCAKAEYSSKLAWYTVCQHIFTCLVVSGVMQALLRQLRHLLLLALPQLQSQPAHQSVRTALEMHLCLLHFARWGSKQLV